MPVFPESASENLNVAENVTHNQTLTNESSSRSVSSPSSSSISSSSSSVRTHSSSFASYKSHNSTFYNQNVYICKSTQQSVPASLNKNGITCTMVNQNNNFANHLNNNDTSNDGAYCCGSSVNDNRINMSSSVNETNIMTKESASSLSSSLSSKKTQHVHITSSCSEVEMTYMKSNLSELKSSITEMKNVCNNNSQQPSPTAHNVQSKIPNFIRNDDSSAEPLITYPESPPPPTFTNSITPPLSNVGLNFVNARSNFMAASSTTTSPVNIRNKSSSSSVSSWKMSSKTSNESKFFDKTRRHQSVDDSAHFTHKSRDYKKQLSTSTYHSEVHATNRDDTDTASTKMKNQPALTLPGNINDFLSNNFNDLNSISADANESDIENAKIKYSEYLTNVMSYLKADNLDLNAVPKLLNKIRDMICTAWLVPTHGHELGNSLCNSLRNSGGIDFLISQCVSDNDNVKFNCAKLLEKCLTAENTAYVAENGLEKVVQVACVCTKNAASVEHSRVSTGILEHLFKHSASTCSDVVRLGGLDTIIFECRNNDVETLRHCASALANLSLYGGVDNQEAMITRNAPLWLFPLAVHNDGSIKYYAILAIAVLVANKEIEAAVLKSEALSLVETFVINYKPSEFAELNLTRARGQSKNWLQKLVPVLNSKREEAKNFVSFHFCMEAGIKKAQNNTEIFREIGAIEPLKKVASSPNAIASKYAAQALRLMGEEVPHKLSQQVPLWSVEDVREWIKQISFNEYVPNFIESRVDGDLLLQLTEENLRDDIGINNGIRRRRFMRELQNLKKMADYSSRDVDNLNQFLQSIGPEFSAYTYSMLNAGVDKDFIKYLSQEQLVAECGIVNSIHRNRILNSIKEGSTENFHTFENVAKTLDVFISYRRSTGSQLASLLKVHLKVRTGLSVFIDIERLEAGKFDNNLLQSIRQAKNFILVLTPNALDRCIGDTECKDWVHKEIVAALQSKCNIIPITDNFEWPEPEKLPEDMRAICHFNCIRLAIKCEKCWPNNGGDNKREQYICRCQRFIAIMKTDPLFT